jgi:hypothetical protein
MSDDTVPCIRKVPDYEIRDGLVYFSTDDWAGCMPLRIFRLAMARAAKVLAEHDAGSAEVMPFRRRRGHAAS